MNYYRPLKQWSIGSIVSKPVVTTRVIILYDDIGHPILRVAVTSANHDQAGRELLSAHSASSFTVL